MKEYVFHKDFEGVIIASKDNNDVRKYPRGTKVTLQPNNFIVNKQLETICTLSSSTCQEYLVSNHDSNWEERAKLVNKIALENRKIRSNGKNGVYRFTDEQINILCDKYKEYLEDDNFAIMFNPKLLEADIHVLYRMIKDLNLTI